MGRSESMKQLDPIVQRGKLGDTCKVLPPFVLPFAAVGEGVDPLQARDDCLQIISTICLREML